MNDESQAGPPVPNWLLVMLTSIVLIFTFLEEITIVILFILSIHRLTVVFGEAMYEGEILIQVTSILFMVFTLYTIIIFFLQYFRGSSKAVCICRIIGNILITVIAILHLTTVRGSQEREFVQKTLTDWVNNPQKVIDFKEKHNCQDNHITSEGMLGSCNKFFKNAINDVFTVGRGYKALIGIFWAIIILYNTIGLIGLIIIRKQI